MTGCDILSSARFAGLLQHRDGRSWWLFRRRRPRRGRCEWRRREWKLQSQQCEQRLLTRRQKARRAAPSSCSAGLRSRLQARGTEDATEIERRLSRATDEIEFALSARCFEYSVVNTEVEAAYDELKAIVLRVLGDA